MFSASNIFLALAVLAVVAYVARRFLSRNTQGRNFLLIYDGRLLRLEKVKPVDEGVESIATKKVYPASELVSVSMLDGSIYHLLGAEHIALATHEALEAARLVMLPRMLFSSGGDFKRWLEYGALVVPIAVSIYLGWRVGDMQASLNRLDANVQVVQKIVQSPMVVAPKDPEVKP